MWLTQLKRPKFYQPNDIVPRSHFFPWITKTHISMGRVFHSPRIGGQSCVLTCSLPNCASKIAAYANKGHKWTLFPLCVLSIPLWFLPDLYTIDNFRRKPGTKVKIHHLLSTPETIGEIDSERNAIRLVKDANMGFKLRLLQNIMIYSVLIFIIAYVTYSTNDFSWFEIVEKKSDYCNDSFFSNSKSCKGG